MSRLRTKTQSVSTLTLQHFIQWVGNQSAFSKHAPAVVALWARGFVALLRENLVARRSMAFTPIGHLVVANKHSRKIRLPNGQTSEVKAGFSIRFRGRPSVSAYIKRAEWFLLLQPLMPAESKSTRLALYDSWVSFLHHAIETQARIELRGIGGFHLHRRESTCSNISESPAIVENKVYLRFVSSQKLMDVINNHATKKTPICA